MPPEPDDDEPDEEEEEEEDEEEEEEEEGIAVPIVPDPSPEREPEPARLLSCKHGEEYLAKVCSVCKKARPADMDATSIDCPKDGTQPTEERCGICSSTNGGTALVEGGTHNGAYGHTYDYGTVEIDIT